MYSLPQLFGIFYIYSFFGWLLEVCGAALRNHKFVNRGVLNLPLCPIYGTSAVLFCTFLDELTSDVLFLFLFGMLLASLLEYTTGVVLEKVFHKRLWDYSALRFNIGGYVCLRYSLLWGVLAVCSMLFVNPLLLNLFGVMPSLLKSILLVVGLVLLAVDLIATIVSVRGMQTKSRSIQQLAQEMKKTSHLLENALTRHIQARLQKSFPAIEPEALATEKKPKSTVFAEGVSFYKLVCLFFLGAFLGDIVETIFCLVTSGVLMSRSSVVWGPFSIVWGLACALMTALLHRYDQKSAMHLFAAGTVLGGVYEYICSVFTELAFGTVFWDYSDYPFNLGGRINLLYCFFWGFAAVAWFKVVYPFLSRWIEKLPMKAGKILCNCMIVFMLVNVVVSSAAMTRYSARNAVATGGSVQPATTQFQQSVEEILDERFPDERMQRIYPNAIHT